MDRRRFLQGAATLFCAPAIVKADSLMRIDERPLRQRLMDGILVWVVDDLAADHIHKTLIGRMNNQVFKKEIHVQHQPAAAHNINSEVAYQTARKIKEMKRDMEFSLGGRPLPLLKLFQ